MNICDSSLRYQYNFEKNCLECNEKTAPEWIPRMRHSSVEEKVPPVKYFNRAVKREKIVLLTGDLPRFALLRHFPEDKADPDHYKLGDGEFVLTVDGEAYSLSEQKNTSTSFYEFGTKYDIDLLNGIHVSLEITQAEGSGAGIRLQLQNNSETVKNAEVRMSYGGMCTHGRTYTGAYFFLENDDYDGNIITINDDSACLSHRDIPEEITVCANSWNKIAEVNNRIEFSEQFRLKANKSYENEFFVIRNGEYKKFKSAGFRNIIDEAQQYAEKIIAPYDLSTPDKILDFAFQCAVYNLEYDYTGDMWMEGLHWWTSYFSQNYQISAAICLDQIERAQKALRIIGQVEPYPAPGMTAAGKPIVSHIGVYQHGCEDGLPYYLYQLAQYYDTTGDLEMIRMIWDAICKGIDNFFEKRTGPNGLVDWHLGCNVFLYQADHLALPGDAASPSIFMSGIMKKMAQLAEIIGDEKSRDAWSEKADFLNREAQKRLYDPQEKKFYNHIDLQGKYHRAKYYTDAVFPMLYSDFPDEIKENALNSLWEKMIFKSENGRLLMKVGEFKPSIFANDNVMPTQMCEAARAFYMMGDAETATELMHNVSIAATVDTESPGSFPERMDNEGKGEANYNFGNPIGSFLYTFIAGLFGVQLKDAGEKIQFSPCFPEKWENAHFRLPYAEIKYVMRQEDHDTRFKQYSFTSPTEKFMGVDICVGGELLKVTGLDEECCETYQRFGKTWLRYTGTEKTKTLVFEILSKDAEEKKQVAAVREEQRDEIVVPAAKRYECINLQGYTNTDTIWAYSAWRNIQYHPDLSAYRIKDNRLEIKGVPFDVVPCENDCFSPGMIRVEYGNSHCYTNEIIRENWPSKVEIPIGKSGAQNIALLYISECRSRNTDLDVGKIVIKYEDQTCSETVLNVGKNIDTVFSHFAKDTIAVYMPSDCEKHPIHPGTDYANLLFLPCEKKKIESIEMEIDTADASMALIGVTLMD